MSDYEGHGMPDLSYHSTRAWSGEVYSSMQSVGVMYAGAYGGEEQDLYIGWNFAQGESVLALPKMPEGKVWRLVLGAGELGAERDRVVLPEACTAVLVTALPEPEETETLPGTSDGVKEAAAEVQAEKKPVPQEKEKSGRKEKHVTGGR